MSLLELEGRREEGKESEADAPDARKEGWTQVRCVDVARVGHLDPSLLTLDFLSFSSVL